MKHDNSLNMRYRTSESQRDFGPNIRNKIQDFFFGISQNCKIGPFSIIFLAIAFSFSYSPPNNPRIRLRSSGFRPYRASLPHHHFFLALQLRYLKMRNFRHRKLSRNDDISAQIGRSSLTRQHWWTYIDLSAGYNCGSLCDSIVNSTSFRPRYKYSTNDMFDFTAVVNWRSNCSSMLVESDTVESNSNPR